MSSYLSHLTFAIKFHFVTILVFFDVSADGQPLGRIVMGLYGDVVPKTAANFYHLCVGDKTGSTGNALTYKGSPLHRVIPGFMLQGGDITHGSGVGGESIYGREFADENFIVKHTKKGLLSMANRGPNTGSSQFFITFAETPWLDGRHVVFGEVLEGFDVVDAVERYGSRSGQTSKKLIITDAGAIEN